MYYHPQVKIGPSANKPLMYDRHRSYSGHIQLNYYGVEVYCLCVVFSKANQRKCNTICEVSFNLDDGYVHFYHLLSF